VELIQRVRSVASRGVTVRISAIVSRRCKGECCCIDQLRRRFYSVEVNVLVLAKSNSWVSVVLEGSCASLTTLRCQPDHFGPQSDII
jgi:hypothetical protein